MQPNQDKLAETVVKDLFVELFKGHHDPNVVNNSERYASCFMDYLQQNIKNQVQTSQETAGFLAPTTIGYGFINEFVQHNDSTFFAKISLITGKENKGEQWVNRYQFLSVLVGHRLKRFVQQSLNNQRNPYENMLVKMSLEGLHFKAKASSDADKPYLDTQGILTEIIL